VACLGAKLAAQLKQGFAQYALLSNGHPHRGIFASVDISNSMTPCVLRAPCEGDAGFYGHCPLSSYTVYSKDVDTHIHMYTYTHIHIYSKQLLLFAARNTRPGCKQQ